MDIERFFADLKGRLDAAQREDQHRYRRFFDGLKPKLNAAKHIERELNRHLAHRFNVLDYLRTDELGLSYIIADLLDPRANHGQGSFFLQILLEQLQLTERWSNLDLASTTVSMERVITAQRRIDVYVKIRGGSTEYCLAIENKPYAGDQENQVSDYLEHLAGEFDDRFLLVYLSAAGDPPSDWSLSTSDLDQWTGRFAVMAYDDQNSSEGTASEDETSDPYEAFRESFSLTDWIDICHDNCRVERLRWFLRDTQNFFQRTFGDHHMTTDNEARAVQEYLLSNPENLLVGLAVYESWPTVRDRVCQQFLERLRNRIEQEIAQHPALFGNDIYVGCKYEGKKKYSNRLWVHRSSWCQYDTGRDDSNRRTSIRLESEGPGPNNWFYGISFAQHKSEMTDADSKRRQRLETALREEAMPDFKADDSIWPVYKYANEGTRDWNSLLPELRREYQGEGDEITNYFVNAFLDVATNAVPIIDRLEGLKT